MKKLLLSLIVSTSLFFGVNAQTILINPSTDGGFESGSTFTANSWSVTNGTQVNQWVVSTNATAGFTGANCAYVSNSYSTTTTHSYVITTSSVVHFYRDVTVPAGETNIQLSFNWICQGEGTAFDRMRIWLVPTAFTPTAGTQVTATGTAPSGRIQAGLTNYNLQNTWTTANIALPAAYAGTSFRIIFEWRNDASGGTMPPAGIDNISLTSSSCGLTPTALNTSTITASSANFTWTPGGTEASWDIYYGSSPLSPPSASTAPTATSAIASYSATGLMTYTGYSVYVRANCGGGIYSPWTAAKTFTTVCLTPSLTSTSSGSICGVGNATLGATSDPGVPLNWYTASAGGSSISNSSVFVTPTISSTTVYYVSAGPVGCESSRTPVTASVTVPDAVSASASATNLCFGVTNTVNLTATQTGTNGNVYSFTWNASPLAGSGMPTPVNGASASVSLTAAGNYVYMVTATDGTCTAVSTVNVKSNSLPVIFASATPTAICSGSNVYLNALTTGIGPGIASVGSGSANSTTYPNPFYSLWSNTHNQYLITAAELNAANVFAGNINSLAIEINSGTMTMMDFSVKIGHSSATNMSAFVSSTGFTTVFSAASVTPVVGLNTLNFSTPFNWDGVSNIVIEICHGNSGSSATMSSSAKVDNTSYVSTIHTHKSAASAGAITCGDLTTNLTSYSIRPKFIFSANTMTTISAGNTWQWNPGAINSNTAIVTPVNTGTVTTTQQYTVSTTNTVTTCSNTSTVNVLVSPLPSAPIAYNSSQCGVGVPTASVSGGTSYNWYASPTSTTALQSGASDTYTSSIGATTTWYVTSTTGVCESTTRTSVTQTVSIPDLVTANTSASNLCVGSTNTVTLTAVQSGTNGNVYSFTWNASPVSGSGMPSTVTGSVTTVTPTLPGVYNYTVTATDGVCTTVSSISVALNNPPTLVASANPTVICSGSNVNLNAQSFVSGPQTVPTGYCTPTSSGSACLTLVTINSLNRSSACETGNYIDVPSSSATTNLTPGQTYTISLTTDASAITSVWFDWNRDGVFTAPEWVQPFTTGTTGSVIITVPVSASFGLTKMRIRSRLTGNTNGSGDACTSFGSGECEDYTINILANITASYNWQWNPGAINSNTAIVNPVNTGSVAATQDYTVTVIDPATTCSNTAMATVLVNPLPTAPVATSNTQCGISVPTASVNGGTNYNWYATPTSTAVLQAGTSANYTTAISSTTTWYVSSFNGTCESPRVALTETVTVPDAVTASSSATTLCVGGANTITLTATQTGTTNTYSYTWIASPTSGSGMPTSVNGKTVNVTPTLPNVYTYSLMATDGVCNAASTVTVVLNSLPNINAMATPSAICSGGNLNLLAESINAASGTATVGAQTTTGTAGTPYRQGIGATSDLKVQYLYTKSELNAAGIFQGNITELRFNATTVGSGQMDNFVIKMGSTTTPSLTTNYLVSPSTLVYGPYSYSVSLGQNIHTFDTPFYWDGVSNVIIEICHDAVNPAGGSSSVSMQTATNRTIYSGATGACALSSGTSTTLRPVIGFGAQVGTNVTSSMDFVWNPGAINNNTAIVNPINTGSVASTQVYTATVTNTVTGCVNSTTVGVLVNPIPSTPVAFDNTQCGIGVPTASVSGNPNFLWYATPTSTAVLQAGTSPTYTSSISSTTTWYVSSFSGICESPRVALTQTVTPPPALTIASPTNIICGNTIQTLSVSSTLADYDSYVWIPNTGLYTDASATIPYTSGNASTLYYMTNIAGSVNFSVNAISTISGCATTTNFSITTDNPAITASATPSVICSGSNVNLDAQSITTAASTATIGTGATTGTSYDAIFYHLWGGNKIQQIIRASELAAAGLITGNLTALSINIPTAGMTYSSLAVSIATTTNTDMAAGINNTASFNTVYFNPAYTTLPGINTFNFSSAFNWDGVSNIIIQFCWSNNNTGGTSNYASVVTTTYVSTAYYRADSQPASAICGGTTATSTTSKRALYMFNGQVGSNLTASMNFMWNPGAINSNTAMVNPVNTSSVGSTEIYTVTVSNPATSCTNSVTVGVLVNPIPAVTAASSTASLCSGNSATLTASGATNYTWAPSGDMSSVSLVTPGSSTTYTVSGESLGCASSATVDLNVIQTPTVTASASPTVICLGNSATLTAVSSTADYAWTPAGGTADIAIVSPSSNTTYTVTSTNSGCVGTATVDLSVLTTPVLTVSPSSTLTCSGNSVILTAGGADTYTWSAGGGNTATAVFNPTAMTTYTVDGSNMCGNGTATASINVDSPVTLSASTSATMICLTIESATLTASGTASSFTWSPGGQTTTNITVSPTVTTVYTVSTSNACGVVTSTVTQNVQDCTGIEELFAAGMKVYPNPTTDIVNFEIPTHLVGHVKLEIYDALGKVVALEELSKEVTSLKIAKFEAGVYMFKMISNNGDVKIGRLIKQ